MRGGGDYSSSFLFNLVFAILNLYPLGQWFSQERWQVTAEADDAAIIIITRPNRLNTA